LLVHGSTVATNSLLERRGAAVTLITNAGFEDVLEIGRQNRPQLYGLTGHRPPPLVGRDRRLGIGGRIGPQGEEVEPLDAAELSALGARIGPAESIALCLLHSYANPEHERRVAATLEGLAVPVSVSSELLPEFREYERTATTVINAYVAPVMERYLGRIEAESGADRVRIMGSGGGAIPVARARRESVHTVLSGPAGGVTGALEVARRAGLDRILTFDMGGTSTDVSLCPGRPLHTREFTIAGLPVAVPVLDIHTVGAGGGSLASVDAGGALRVGPESAGAEPGPICYGRGGERVTVTDANVWLGRLPATAWHHRLDGEGRATSLDRSSIEGPLAMLAGLLGTDPDAAAAGVLAVANAAMERALRVISVERGYDPSDFTLVPFGGAAGLHAAALADRLSIPRLLVPPDPGVLSAWGMLVAPVRKDAARTVLWSGAEAERAMGSVFAALEADALEAMAEEGIAARSVELRRRIDARYRGQSFELSVPVEGWTAAFHEAHRIRYGYDRPDAVVEAVTLRVEALAEGAGVPDVRLPAAPEPDPPVADRAPVAEHGQRMDVPRYERADLLAGHRMAGPCIVSEYSSTLWLPAGWRARVLDGGSLLAERGAAPAG
jgi:N-methylhydantoinase A